MLRLKKVLATFQYQSLQYLAAELVLNYFLPYVCLYVQKTIKQTGIKSLVIRTTQLSSSALIKKAKIC